MGGGGVHRKREEMDEQREMGRGKNGEGMGGEERGFGNIFCEFALKLIFVNVIGGGGGGGAARGGQVLDMTVTVACW